MYCHVFGEGAILFFYFHSSHVFDVMVVLSVVPFFLTVLTRCPGYALLSFR